jgi:hypothetical protein
MIFKNEFQHKVLNTTTRMTCLVAFLFTASFLTSCDDGDDNGFQSVAGKWAGDKTELIVKVVGVPTPINKTDESFAGKVEFKQNGTAIYSEDGEVTEGTWSQNNNKLTLSIPTDDDEVDMSGVYTIQEITGSKLKLYIEKESTIKDPDTGAEFEAFIKATLYFYKN